MSKLIVFKNFYDFTVNSQSSEDALWPAANVEDVGRQFLYWKTTVATDSWVILDLGSTQSVTGVGLINTNYTSFKIQGSASTSFASPATDSGTVTAKKDTMRGRYYSYVSPQTFSPVFNYRYLRLFIPTQSTTDGSSVFRTGGIVIKTGTTEINDNPDWSLSISIARPADVIQMRGGRREVRNISERLASMQFSIKRDLREVADMEEIADLFVTIDESDPILVFDNGGFLTYPTNSPSVYIFKRVDAAGGTMEKYPTFSLNTLSFLEQK
jgi:hypothetical protein